MKTNTTSKKLTVLILSGILIFGCKKETTDLSNTESAATTSTATKPLSLSSDEPQKPIKWFTTVYNTDYLSVGTGGLRDDDIGQINVIGTFPLNSVTKAYLYWHGDSPIEAETGITMKLNGLNVTGTNIGVTWMSDGTGNPPYIGVNSQAYRADVTAVVKSSSSRVFTVSNFGQLIANGASLILFYQDGNSNNNRDIVLFNGNDWNGNTGFSGPGLRYDYDRTGWDVLLSGVKYTSGIVNVTMHVSDGQHFIDDYLYLNNVELGRKIFKGNSVPGSTATRAGRWDIMPIEVSRILTPGINSMRLTTPEAYDDFLNLIVVVFNLPKGAAPVQVVK
ncbi:hypothetical protein [Arcticibacter eurypsychrophilus]|uniref:hypothetical protein n=1 Tax=Arcticibacter eurypsychrophilus TaxID=1434752 RepID=UPI00084D2601|nr:hypothetical protein [Arcticibacter eurypsychrophilus]